MTQNVYLPNPSVTRIDASCCPIQGGSTYSYSFGQTTINRCFELVECRHPKNKGQQIGKGGVSLTDENILCPATGEACDKFGLQAGDVLA